MIALVDCNNFYASCERVFQPELLRKPIVILSNNDGCVIARSNEAKSLGIEMGVPYFKIRDAIERHKIFVRSSNYELYGDISRRVMTTLLQLTSDVEVYSIDEAFCDLSGFSDRNLLTYAKDIRATILQWTGIPVSIGIAPTKTLAKLVNRIAKKASGTLVMADGQMREALLATTGVNDIWGIGRQLTQRLEALGIRTALELTSMPDSWIRKNLSIVGLRTVHELRGIPCISWDEHPPAKQSIMTSRAFGRPIETIDELSQAITTYATRAAEKLRKEKRQARHIDIFFHSSPYLKPFSSGRASYDLPMSTSSTLDIIHYAIRGIKSQFRSGVSYVKAGLILSDFNAPNEQQLNFFQTSGPERSDLLMQTLDATNARWGKDTLFFAAAGIRGKQPWTMKREMRSPSYTTRLCDILEIR